MEQYEQSGYQFLKFFTDPNNKLETGDLNTPLSGSDNIIRENGQPSIINRYALFTYKGRESIDTSNYTQTPFSDNVDIGESSARGFSNDLITALQASQSTDYYNNIADNPKAAQIVNYFQENNHNAVEYELIDFLYCKYYGLISNNYMITLRRFPFAVEDNIFQKAFCPNPDIARCVTYWGTGTGNDLNTILGFNTGFEWKELIADVQTLNSQRWGNFFGGQLGHVMDATSRAADLNSTLEKDKQRDINNGSNNAHLDEQGEGYYHNKILGPVNVIHKMYIRDRGIKYEQPIKLSVEYKMKAYGNIKPKDAMLEILTNLLTLGTNNAPFWGGSIRYRGDNRTSYLMGSKEALLRGDYSAYISSVGNDLSGKLSAIFKDDNGQTTFGSIIGGLFDAGKSMLSGIVSKNLTSSGAVPQYQVVNALLTGESTGEWHVTVGNPLRPIAVIGNLILDDMHITFDETLGSEDFPIGIKAEFDLKPARPRDKQDIENMFNLGQGRLWYKPATKSDITNSINARKDQQNHSVIDKSSKGEKERQYTNDEQSQINDASFQKILFRFPNHTKTEDGNGIGISNALKFHSVNENYWGDNKQAK